ncbi:hypothetical protein XPA_009036 [Xanthoria parietina]
MMSYHAFFSCSLHPPSGPNLIPTPFMQLSSLPDSVGLRALRLVHYFVSQPTFSRSSHWNMRISIGGISASHPASLKPSSSPAHDKEAIICISSTASSQSTSLPIPCFPDFRSCDTRSFALWPKDLVCSVNPAICCTRH